MKVFIQTDMEGCAGVVSFTDQAYADGRYHERAKRLVTLEVNAAVDVLYNDGVEEIIVNDGHGPGAIFFEDLHPQTQLLHGRPPAPRSRRNEFLKEFDITMMIGQHAMAGVKEATLNHTQNSRAVTYYTINGKPVGEIGQWALYAGALGIPLIFLSGDTAACNEAQDLIPGITTAAVKRGLGRNSAISCSMEEAHRRIREGVKDALQHHANNPVRPLVWEGPFVLEKRLFTSEMADSAEAMPGYERVDELTVRYRGESVMDVAYR